MQLRAGYATETHVLPLIQTPASPEEMVDGQLWEKNSKGQGAKSTQNCSDNNPFQTCM